MRNQKGFTLIELIIVIVVLGILAVTAAPQFIDFSSDARKSAVNGLKGGLQGAAQTVYGRAAIDGILLENPGTTSVGSYTTVFGYPSVDSDTAGTADTNGIIKAAGLGSEGSDWVWGIDSNNIAIAPTGFNELDTSSTYSEIKTEDCFAEYTQATNTNSNNANETVEPSITVTVTGC